MLVGANVQGKANALTHLSAATDGEPAHDSSLAAPASAHVLIADADPDSRATREADLRARGLRVSVARTGFEAIVKASCHLPDLILLAPSMGDLDAAATMQLLSTCPATAHIPIVRLSRGRRVPPRALSGLRSASM